MSAYLVASVVFYTFAMGLYTVGVWTVRKADRWHGRHIYIFLTGVLVDIIATLLAIIAVGGIVFTTHAIMGFISLGLMTGHVFWALCVWHKADQRTFQTFRQASLFVWLVWMFTYISGFASGLLKFI